MFPTESVVSVRCSADVSNKSALWHFSIHFFELKREKLQCVCTVRPCSHVLREAFSFTSAFICNDFDDARLPAATFNMQNQRGKHLIDAWMDKFQVFKKRNGIAGLIERDIHKHLQLSLFTI